MRALGIAALLVLSFLACSTPVIAGGWAMVRLDTTPGEVVAGVPWKFGFMVRQHDVSPTNDVEPVVTAQHQETGDVITATAQQEGPVGHFVAELTFPRAGQWKWEIRPEPFAETAFEVLDVSGRAGIGEGTETSLDSLPDRSRSELVATLGAAEMVNIVNDSSFAPSRTEISAGTTVIWTNTSEVAHTVTGDDLTFDDSGILEPGQTFNYTFAEPGTYAYHCSPHPYMTGVVVVT